MRRPVASSVWWDAGLALAVIGLCEVQFATEHGQHLTEALVGPTWLGIVSGLLLGLPLLGRRRFPVGTALTIFGAALLLYWLGFSGYGYFGEIVAGVIAVFTVASRTAARTSLTVLAYAYVCVVLSSLALGFYNHIGSALLLGAPWALGRAARSRRLLIEELRTTSHDLQVSRAQNEAAAIAAERVRIARELHDIVAHAVSVMVVQAGAAERKLDRNPQLAREPMLAIQDTGRQALTELRRLLRVLRPGAAEESALTPQPGLDDLEALADSVRSAGLAVQVIREDAGCVLSDGVGLAAFRIVQEALTNTLKHAGAGTARVAVRLAGDALELEIIDDGRAQQANPLSAGQHGIAGMRERVVLYGGHIEVGPHRDGGFAVRARLPVNAPT